MAQEESYDCLKAGDANPMDMDKYTNYAMLPHSRQLDW